MPFLRVPVTFPLNPLFDWLCYFFLPVSVDFTYPTLCMGTHNYMCRQYLHSVKATDYLIEMLKHCSRSPRGYRTVYIHVTLKEAETYLCFLSLTYPKTQLYIQYSQTTQVQSYDKTKCFSLCDKCSSLCFWNINRPTLCFSKLYNLENVLNCAVFWSMSVAFIVLYFDLLVWQCNMLYLWTNLCKTKIPKVYFWLKFMQHHQLGANLAADSISGTCHSSQPGIYFSPQWVNQWV